MQKKIRWGVAGVLLGCLVALAGCSLFNAAPTVAFSWSPIEPLARKNVQFTDLSTDSNNIVSWVWDFGDSQSSVSKNPVHAYQKSGTYTVRLTVTDEKGATGVAQLNVIVGQSVDGNWRGTITDGFYVQWTLELHLNHSTSGGITGTMTIGSDTQTINAASFNPDTGEVQLTCNVFGLILRGTLNANENKLSGWWYDTTWGDRWEDWSVTLQ